MKITRVDAIPVGIPLRRPMQFASGAAHVADHVIIRIHTDEGLVGHAEAPPRPYTYGESAETIVGAVTQWFGPALVNLDPLAREQVEAAMSWVVGNPAAKAAVDVAVWDLAGQYLGQPCHVLLGGYATSVPVAHMLGFRSSPEAVVEEALELRERYGITAYKVKVGRPAETEDIGTCTALREALGPDATLYVDANRGWGPSQAIRAMRRMADLDLWLLEEPNPADDLIGRRRIVEALDIPVLGDESAATLAQAAQRLCARSCDMVSIKVARTGFTESARLLALCDALGAEVVVGNQIDGMLGSLAAASFACAHASTAGTPAEVSNFLDCTDHLLAGPVEIANGRFEVRDQPGLGAQIDEEKLDRYRQDR